MANPIPLKEMIEAAKERADHHAVCAAHYRENYPDVPMFEHHRRNRDVFDGIVKLLTILAGSEEKSRRFVTRLMEEQDAA